MRYIILTLVAVLMCLILLTIPTGASSYIDPDSDYNEDLNRNYVEEFNSPNKRACIRRGGNCDHRPNDCCYQSSCRCNLWGSNCRCQRMGLFQKWG